ncbi:MAG: MBL fold metallo-hydrolase, partial [Alphaproteobacteria bacterium]
MRDESLLSDRDAPAAELDYPFAAVPEAGAAIAVAPGVYWIRMALPMQLDHINLWLLDDGDGVAIVDTGLRTRDTQARWQAVLKDVVGSRRITRIIVTHMHPDHVGMAGWLHRETGAPLFMTRTEYLTARVLTLDNGGAVPEDVLDFYRAAGFSEEQLAARRNAGWGNFARVVSPLPAAYRRLCAGDVLPIGGCDWQIVVGHGHSPEHACLMCAELGVIITGDQVLPRISSNVSVFPTEPEADPLGDWLRSLHGLKALPDGLLALPA